MSPSRIFILRPVATSLLMIAIMLSGIVAFQFLPLSALPEVYARVGDFIVADAKPPSTAWPYPPARGPPFV